MRSYTSTAEEQNVVTIMNATPSGRTGVEIGRLRVQARGVTGGAYSAATATTSRLVWVDASSTNIEMTAKTTAILANSGNTNSIYTAEASPGGDEIGASETHISFTYIAGATGP